MLFLSLEVQTQSPWTETKTCRAHSVTITTAGSGRRWHRQRLAIVARRTVVAGTIGSRQRRAMVHRGFEGGPQFANFCPFTWASVFESQCTDTRLLSLSSSCLQSLLVGTNATIVASFFLCVLSRNRQTTPPSGSGGLFAQRTEPKKKKPTKPSTSKNGAKLPTKQEFGALKTAAQLKLDPRAPEEYRRQSSQMTSSINPPIPPLPQGPPPLPNFAGSISNNNNDPRSGRVFGQ